MKLPGVLTALSSLVLMAGCFVGEAGEDTDTSESNLSAVSAKPFEGTCTPDARVCAYFAPTDMPIQVILEAIRNAQQSIRIATYNVNIPEIATLLRRRMDEGIKVDFVMDLAHVVEDEHEANSVWSMLGEHPNLTRYKVPVLRGGTPQMHDKILIVDNARVFFGSANFTYTGLVGNFENVMAVRDPEIVRRYGAEIDELMALSKAACESFGTPTSACGKATETYPADFTHLALEGAFQAAPAGPIDGTKTACKSLLTDREGLLIAGNQPRIADLSVLKGCFVDPALGDKYAAFVTTVAGQEKYSDGSLVKTDPPILERITPSGGGTPFDVVSFKHRDTQTGPMRAYFSGEDDVEYTMLKELRRLEENPGESFAYLSTNFITNSRLAKQLATLKTRGVRMRVFFDRGRFLDPNFHSQFSVLSQLGFTFGLNAQKTTVARTGSKWTITRTDAREDEASLANNLVSVFDNDLSGNYGANHNKFAVLGRRGTDGKYKVVVLNGSANWSSMAMQQNDENLVVAEDPFVGSIYLREMLSQLFVYRYGQVEQSPGFLADMEFVASRIPCVRAVMGQPTTECLTPTGAQWKPAVSSTLVLAAKGIPNNLDGSRRTWAWVANWKATEDGPSGRAFELFSSRTFEGKWVTGIPYAPGATLDYKFFTAPASIDPNRDGLGAGGIEWEYGGMGNDRRATLSSRPVIAIRGSNLRWGAP